MQRGVQEVPAPVAREDAAGPVAAVGRGREPEEQHASLRISEPGDGAPPVLLIGEASYLLSGDELAPCNQARAAPARHHLGLDPRELGHARPSWTRTPATTKLVSMV